ncbi:hypothetical protein ACFSJY_18585 [Thalassotalea euphylliae]|uniref:hypothetical protein n=1 Tax=Thalassotalea euphylliae TaxID=1655234 RepID=UPI0036312A3D
MKKLASTLLLLGLTSTAMAQTPKNVIERPITLADGELMFSGALMFGEQTDGEDEWIVAPGIAYGVTDDFSISLGDLRYRFMERENNGHGKGLELTFGIGFEGQREVRGADDSNGVYADITGKYVFNRDTAAYFSTAYVHWGEDKRDDRSEIRYTVGIQQNLINNVSAFASYTYSDLRDFEDDSANAGSVGLNYALSKTMDVGMFVSYSDFDAEDNGYKADDIFEKSAGIYFATRF